MTNQHSKNRESTNQYSNNRESTNQYSNNSVSTNQYSNNSASTNQNSSNGVSTNQNSSNGVSINQNSLWDGEYNEKESANSFQEALNEWRNGGEKSLTGIQFIKENSLTVVVKTNLPNKR